MQEPPANPYYQWPDAQPIRRVVSRGLPSRGAVLMSDDPRRLLLLQSWAAQKGKLKDYLFVDSGGTDAAGHFGALTYPEYIDI